MNGDEISEEGEFGGVTGWGGLAKTARRLYVRSKLDESYVSTPLMLHVVCGFAPLAQGLACCWVHIVFGLVAHLLLPAMSPDNYPPDVVNTAIALFLLFCRI